MEKKVPERKVKLREEDIFYVYDKRINRCIREGCEGTVKYGLVLRVAVTEDETMNCFECNKCHMKYTPYPNYVRITVPHMLHILNQDEVTARDRKRAEDARKQAQRERRQGGFGKKQHGAGKPYGERKPYGEHKPYGERKPYGEHKPYGERKSYGERKPYGERPAYGEHKPYGERKQYGEHKRSAYGEHKSYNARPANGEHRPYEKKKNVYIANGNYRSSKPSYSKPYGNRNAEHDRHGNAEKR